MLALDPDTVLVLEPGIVLRSLPDQDFFFAFNVITGDEFNLNRTSYFVLEAIGDGIEWVRLKEAFLKAFDVETQEGEADLLELVCQFYDEKIVGRQGNGK